MTSPRRTLGRSGVAVSPLGFGAAPLGNLYTPLDEETARATVDAAWEAGVRYFDTAPHYGLGLSERRLGEALRARPRGEFTVSTKVGRLLEPHPEPSGSDLAAGGFAVPDTLRRRSDYSRDGVLRSLDASLERLGLDRIDLALVHDPDDHMDTALAEALPALAELRAQGVVGAIGVGMNSVNPLRRFVAEGDPDVVMVAGRWTLLDRTAAPLLAVRRARGLRHRGGALQLRPAEHRSPRGERPLRLRHGARRRARPGPRPRRPLRRARGPAAPRGPVLPAARARRGERPRRFPLPGGSHLGGRPPHPRSPEPALGRTGHDPLNTPPAPNTRGNAPPSLTPALPWRPAPPGDEERPQHLSAKVRGRAVTPGTAVAASHLAGSRSPTEVTSAAGHLTHGVPNRLWAELDTTP
ncbi:aldo/keto reductase [Streptomyces sp. NPDC006684]|uniref:aldo/keto reductase n=1 Tax=Streptomyces sp. NPDC006684 TaxID=3154477 RepID=UPI003456E3A5